jgi:hypothetical protein
MSEVDLVEVGRSLGMADDRILADALDELRRRLDRKRSANAALHTEDPSLPTRYPESKQAENE